MGGKTPAYGGATPFGGGNATPFGAGNATPYSGGKTSASGGNAFSVRVARSFVSRSFSDSVLRHPPALPTMPVQTAPSVPLRVHRMPQEPAACGQLGALPQPTVVRLALGLRMHGEHLPLLHGSRTLPAAGPAPAATLHGRQLHLRQTLAAQPAIRAERPKPLLPLLQHGAPHRPHTIQQRARLPLAQIRRGILLSPLITRIRPTLQRRHPQRRLLTRAHRHQLRLATRGETTTRHQHQLLLIPRPTRLQRLQLRVIRGIELYFAKTRNFRNCSKSEGSIKHDMYV